MDTTTADYKTIREESVHGRYVTEAHIAPFVKKISSSCTAAEVGRSVEGRPIYTLTLGSGTRKVFMWSQMHGNESTTTKAALDLMNFLTSPLADSEKLMRECQIKIIPILNPDGAHKYTRLNANEIDLNRDAQALSQPESRILREVYDSFKPDFCFNLHGQRTLFSAGPSPLPATVSFLAPAFDKERGLSASRIRSMQLIAAMAARLQHSIPGQVGRYDDAFNPNCVGDTFQMLNTPTLLFEGGHYQGDYQREKTRIFLFQAFCESLRVIAHDRFEEFSAEAYFSIPENKELFFDVLVRNPHVLNQAYEQGSSIGIQFKEILEGQRIRFQPELSKVGELSDYFGHMTYDCQDPSDMSKLKETKEILDLLI